MDNQFFIDSEYLPAQALVKKHALESDPTTRTNHMEYLPDMEIIQSDICEKVIAQIGRAHV